MDISKLEVGMRVKNYKALCGLLGEEVKTGNAKTSQMKELDRFVKYRKEGFAFIIQEIYSEPKEKVDKRKDPNKIGNNRKEFKEFKIKREFENRNGVYIAKKRDKVYIGSTFSEHGFRGRFLQHRKANEKVWKLVKGYGTFKALWICPENLEDEYIVRHMEAFLIKQYKDNPEYTVINSKDETNEYGYTARIEEKALSKGWFLVKKITHNRAICQCVECGYEKIYSISTLKSPVKCRCNLCERIKKNESDTLIKINAKLEDYSRIIQILKENNIEFTEQKKKGVQNEHKQNKTRNENKEL